MLKFIELCHQIIFQQFLMLYSLIPATFQIYGIYGHCGYAGCTAFSSIDGRTLNLYFPFQFQAMIPNFYDFTIMMFVKCVVLGYRLLV